MSKKIYLPVMLLVLFAMALGACAPAAPATVEAPVVEEAPAATAVPTEAPVVEEPVVVEAPDFQAIFADVIANNGKDKAYGTMNAEALNTEMIENSDLYVIDVREPSELEEVGHIPGAVNIPVKTLSQQPGLLTCRPGCPHCGLLQKRNPLHIRLDNPRTVRLHQCA